MHSNVTRLAVAVSLSWLFSVAGAAHAQVQTKSQIKCITSMNDAVSKVAKSQYGLQAKCLKAAASGTLPVGQDMAACVLADSGGKVAAQVSKAAARETKVCPSGLVDYAYTSSATATTAGIDSARNAYEDIAAFGVSGAVLSSTTAPDGSKCQAAIAKGVSKLHLATLAAFRACKKAGLTDGSISSTIQLGNQCFDAITADASGKIGAATAKLADTYASKCSEVVQSTVIPGVCASAPDVAACIATVARCRTCQAFNAADNLVRGCDDFDDGAINGSCQTSTICDDDDEDTYGENCDAGDDCNDVNPNIHPGAEEVCNGIDDDCNFFVDDSPSGTGGACGSNSVPPCMLGTTECVNGSLECVGSVEPVAETCNGVDDDCNGTPDDSPTDVGTPCGSSETPPCALGTNQCVDGSLECSGNVEPVAEICNGVDDDCNGTPDDSAPCDPGMSCQSGMCQP